MSHSQIHKIHTTSLQVQFAGIEEGLGLQDRLALVFHEKIKPALEKEFDQLADPWLPTRRKLGGNTPSANSGAGEKGNSCKTFQSTHANLKRDQG